MPSPLCHASFANQKRGGPSDVAISSSLLSICVAIVFAGRADACEVVLDTLKVVSHPIIKYCGIVVETFAHAATGSGECHTPILLVSFTQGRDSVGTLTDIFGVIYQIPSQTHTSASIVFAQLTTFCQPAVCPCSIEIFVARGVYMCHHVAVVFTLLSGVCVFRTTIFTDSAFVVAAAVAVWLSCFCRFLTVLCVLCCVVFSVLQVQKLLSVCGDHLAEDEATSLHQVG